MNDRVLDCAAKGGGGGMKVLLFNVACLSAASDRNAIDRVRVCTTGKRRGVFDDDS